MAAESVRKRARRSKSLAELDRLDRSEFTELEQLPNIGRSLADDFRLLGVTRPGDLVGRDPFALYEQLCRATGQRQDPCVLDTFIAAVRFMEGDKAKPWWAYTAERKRRLSAEAAPGRTSR